LRLAHARGTLGRSDAAREAMETLLAIEPAARADPELYSPSFRREFERARVRVEKRPRLKLTIVSPRGPSTAAVGCRPIGDAPAEVDLPPGRYRISVLSGLGIATVSVDLEADRTVELDPPAAELAPLEPKAASAVAASPGPELPPIGAEPTSVRAGEIGVSPWMRPAGFVLGSLALVSAGVAVWQGIEATHAASEARALVLPGGSLAPGTSPATYAAALASFASERRNAWIAGGATCALSAGAALLFALPEGGPVTPSPGGATIRF
jgi:hypothetical protein